MPEMKECFGQLANLSVRFRDLSKQHYLRVDEEKLKECDTCRLFTKCMFLKYNDLFKEVLTLLDSVGAKESHPRMG